MPQLNAVICKHCCIVLYRKCNLLLRKLPKVGPIITWNKLYSSVSSPLLSPPASLSHHSAKRSNKNSDVGLEEDFAKGRVWEETWGYYILWESPTFLSFVVAFFVCFWCVFCSSYCWLLCLLSSVLLWYGWVMTSLDLWFVMTTSERTVMRPSVRNEWKNDFRPSSDAVWKFLFQRRIFGVEISSPRMQKVYCSC